VNGQKGDVYLDGSANSSAGIMLRAKASSTAGNVIIQTGAATNWGSFVLFNGASTPAEIFRVLGNGNVGIGTSAPILPLSISSDSIYGMAVGEVSGAQSEKHLLIGYERTNNWATIAARQEGVGPRPVMLQKDGGNVGIGTGTAAPVAALQIKAPQGIEQFKIESAGTEPNIGTIGTLAYAQNNVALLFDMDYNVNGSLTNNSGFSTRAATGAMFYKLNNRFSLLSVKNGPTAGPINAYTENIGVDLTSGSISLGAPSTTTEVTVNGNLTATGTVTSTYQDIAEWVPSGERLAPGTVVVVNRDRDNEVVPSARSYDTGVAGVVSVKPGLILGVAASGKSQIATTGRVIVRVDASKRAVHVGDLLVTSDRSGMAMVSEPVDVGGVSMHRPGTLIGKALQPLASGQGEVLVLLSLQ
jgi:hypothetical protein